MKINQVLGELNVDDKTNAVYRNSRRDIQTAPAPQDPNAPKPVAVDQRPTNLGGPNAPSDMERAAQGRDATRNASVGYTSSQKGAAAQPNTGNVSYNSIPQNAPVGRAARKAAGGAAPAKGTPINPATANGALPGEPVAATTVPAGSQPIGAAAVPKRTGIPSSLPGDPKPGQPARQTAPPAGAEVPPNAGTAGTPPPAGTATPNPPPGAPAAAIQPGNATKKPQGGFAQKAAGALGTTAKAIGAIGGIPAGVGRAVQKGYNAGVNAIGGPAHPTVQTVPPETPAAQAAPAVRGGKIPQRTSAANQPDEIADLKSRLERLETLFQQP